MAPQLMFNPEENPNPVMRCNLQGELLYANHVAKGLLSHWGIDIHDKLPPILLSVIKKALRLKNVQEKEITIKKEYFLFRINPILSQNYLNIFGFNFSKDHINKRLSQIETIDALTGLLNRQTLLTQIEAKIDKKLPFVFTIINIKQFQTINDEFGHHVGDLLLMNIAQRLITHSDKNTLLGRLSGAEFAFIVPYDQDIQLVKNKAAEIHQELIQPYLLLKKTVQIQIAMGATIFPKNGKKLNHLLKNTYTALTFARTKTDSKFYFFEEKIKKEIAREEKLSHELFHALEKEELILHYQPQASCKGNKLIGFEALVRWQHPEYGLLFPSAFTTVIELPEFSEKITFYLLDKACKQWVKFNEIGHGHLSIAVNIPVPVLMQTDFVDKVKKIVKMSGANPRQIELEILERSFMDSFEIVGKNLHGLKKMGIRVAIDDFGTGYSSLSYLKNLPIHKLKIDASFVADIGKHHDSTVIIESIIMLGKRLKMKVLAEGVETEEQFDFLKFKKCDSIQGYLYSKPLTPEDLTALLK